MAIPTMAPATTTTRIRLRICRRRFVGRLASAASRASLAARWRALLSLGTARDPTQSRATASDRPLDRRQVAAPRGPAACPGRRSRPCAVCSLVRMPVVVQKFGGTSVGDAERIRAVADHIARTRRQGTDVVAVVSAMGKTTDDLIHLANCVSSIQPPALSTTCSSAPGSASPCRCCAWRWPSSGSTPPPSPGARSASSPTTTTPGPRSRRSRATACARRWPPGRCPSWRVSRASRRSARSRRSAGAGPTPRPWHWRPCSAPTPARSTPTSPACSPPTPGSCPRRTASTGSRSTRCSRWRPPAAGS